MPTRALAVCVVLLTIAAVPGTAQKAPDAASAAIVRTSGSRSRGCREVEGLPRTGIMLTATRP